MALKSGYSVECCQADDRAALASKMFELSQITWQQIKASGRHAAGFEKLSRSSLRVPLGGKVTEDVQLIVFRYSGMKAMIGYRQDKTFHILLLDHNFTCYSH